MNKALIPTMCHGCSYGGYNCGMLAHVENGRFTRVEGNPDHPLNRGGLCAKGQAAVQWVYNPNRLKTPLAGIGDRGQADFRPVSWETALESIANRLLEIRERYGPETIIFSKGQSSGWGGLHHLLWMRFMHVLGSITFSNWGPSVCYSPQLMYYRQIIGGPTYPRPDYDNADLIIEWFTGGGTGGPARGGVETLDTNLRSVPVKIIDRVEQGAKLIIINPQLIPLGANGRAHKWLPIRPGTDGALALAMMQVIIEEGLVDRPFIDQWCERFEALKAHVHPYTPEWAEPITGLPAREIREVARLYGSTKRACLRVSEAPQKEDLRSFAQSVATLIAITGHLDRPGGNIYFFPAGHLRFSTLSQRVPKRSKERLLGADKFSVRASGGHSAFFPSVIEALMTGKPYRPRAMLIFGSNPLGTARNPALMAEALGKLDLVVVVDVARTPTSRFADFVLPAATRYECREQPALWSNHLSLSQRIIDPLWNTRDELEVTLELACRMGFGNDFWQGDYTAMVNEFLKPVGISLNQLKKHASEGIYLPRTEFMDQRERFVTLFRDLPNGKIQLVNKVLEGEGVNPLPVYRGERESWERTERQNRQRLLFTDEHSAFINHHAWMRDIPYLRELQRHAEVKIHPQTAERFGIREGDWVEITSPHGTMKAVARLFPGIRPDTLMGQHGWWQGCPTLGLPETSPLNGGTNPNVLYNWEYLDPLSGDISKNTFVTIRKGSPPEEPIPKEEKN